MRAVYELAKRKGDGPTKISTIAKAQAIPLRFLEVILHQLKGSGIVESKRGSYGGYYLVGSPAKTSVGDVLRYIQKDRTSAKCIACVSEKACPFLDRCAFSSLWHKVKTAAYRIYDETSMQDLLNAHEPGGLAAAIDMEECPPGAEEY